jgi:hypothetical protein
MEKALQTILAVVVVISLMGCGTDEDYGNSTGLYIESSDGVYIGELISMTEYANRSECFTIYQDGIGMFDVNLDGIICSTFDVFFSTDDCDWSEMVWARLYLNSPRVAFDQSNRVFIPVSVASEGKSASLSYNNHCSKNSVDISIDLPNNWVVLQYSGKMLNLGKAPLFIK